MQDQDGMDNVRVLNIMLAKVKGGVETMARLYHRALEARGFDVLSVGHPDGVLAAGLPAEAFRPLNARFNHDPMALLTLDGYLREFRPDVVLTHGNRAAGLALFPGMRSAGRTVAVLHNAFFKRHLARARAALCVSESIAGETAKVFPGLPLRVVPNFAELEVFAPRATWRDPPVIGALGRLHEQKGFDVLVRAAAWLRDDGVPFRLRIGGEGEDRPLLEGLIRDLGLGDCVELAGWISPPGPFLAGLDLFVVPSRYEPFGLVVIEAMAAGVPILASALEGPQEILEGGRLGRLFASENPQALARAVKAALAEPEDLRALAHDAQAQAVRTYGFDAGADRLCEALGSLH
jgi:glycosyltransferase involved in cell wall biosynthesis